MVSMNDLTDAFGKRVYEGSASLFIGAGLSIEAGYPGWTDLLAPILRAANVPEAAGHDASLSAEFAAQELGREKFNERLLQQLVAVQPKTSATSQKLAHLPVREYWTTNFDNVLEDALGSDAERVIADGDYATAGGRSPKRLTKMHGSLSLGGGSIHWESGPVITRSDFEAYQMTHPLIWAQLRAQFLTSSILFLGLSFNDPNVSVLLQLSRSIDPAVVRHPHFAVLKRESDPLKEREFQLRVRDLETSGIRIGLINDFKDIEQVVDAIRRRSRGPNLFVSGSGIETDTEEEALCRAIGARFADIDHLSVVSLAGPAALAVSTGFNSALRADEYDPERIRFYFRHRHDRPAPDHPKRMGTCIYTRLEVVDLRDHVLQNARAMIVLGGSNRTRDEVARAQSLRIPVIPVGAVPGLSEELWQRNKPSELDLDGLISDEDWTRLGSSDHNQVTRSVAHTVARVMSLS